VKSSISSSYNLGSNYFRYNNGGIGGNASGIGGGGLGGKGVPGPCSAKAIYRLADKLRLMELKGLAREFIIKSLTPQNIPVSFHSFCISKKFMKFAWGI
jgi:hypothetical protein